MKEQLKKANTLVELIDTIALFYDLHNNTPSKMIKDIVTSQIKRAVNITDNYVLDAANKSITLHEYLLTFGYYYDEKNDFLNPIHRNKLIDSLPNLLTVTRAKQIK
jgi:hypothetical protein